MKTSHRVLHDVQTSRTRVPLGGFDIDRGRLPRCAGSDGPSTDAGDTHDLFYLKYLFSIFKAPDVCAIWSKRERRPFGALPLSAVALLGFSS